MEFIKDYTYKNIRKKFILLYSLNVLDIIFTLLLLRTGLFKEINGTMVGIVENAMLSLFLKIVVVGILVFAVAKRMLEATNKQLRISNVIISFMLLIYIIINLMHISYVLIYISI